MTWYSDRGQHSPLEIIDASSGETCQQMQDLLMKENTCAPSRKLPLAGTLHFLSFFFFFRFNFFCSSYFC